MKGRLQQKPAVILTVFIVLHPDAPPDPKALAAAPPSGQNVTQWKYNFTLSHNLRQKIWFMCLWMHYPVGYWP